MKRFVSNAPAVVAANRELIGDCFRVVYRNRMDGKKRVFIGSLSHREALAVLDKWGDPKKRCFYMGADTAIEPCDGAPDGAILEEGGSE